MGSLHGQCGCWNIKGYFSQKYVRNLVKYAIHWKKMKIIQVLMKFNQKNRQEKKEKCKKLHEASLKAGYDFTLDEVNK